MSAAEAMGVYMAKTVNAFVWLAKKFSTPSRRKSKHKKERHSIYAHHFYYVPAYGEVVDPEVASAHQSNILPCLDRGRKKEMAGGEGIIGNFEYIGGGGNGMLRYRWLSHSCQSCLTGKFDACDLGSASPKIMSAAVAEKSRSGAAEATAVIKERVGRFKDKIKAGMFVALYQQIDEDNRKFVIAQVAKPCRRSVKGEKIGNSRAQSAQKWVMEVHFGERQRTNKGGTVKYKFESGECCTETYDNCGEVKGCRLRHTDKVFVDAVLPPLPISMVRHGNAKPKRKKKQRTQSGAGAGHTTAAPVFHILPPGDEQKVLATLSSDLQNGTDKAYIVR